jgi:hypothetical protein
MSALGEPGGQASLRKNLSIAINRYVQYSAIANLGGFAKFAVDAHFREVRFLFN